MFDVLLHICTHGYFAGKPSGRCVNNCRFINARRHLVQPTAATTTTTTTAVDDGDDDDVTDVNHQSSSSSSQRDNRSQFWSHGTPDVTRTLAMVQEPAAQSLTSVPSSTVSQFSVV